MQILDALKFKEPTPIQLQSIPIALEGKDLMGIAQTGTGKTLAFGIPMIQKLAQNPGQNGLILLPTRELAVQVNESLNLLGRNLGMKTAILIGGESINRQIQTLRRGPHIVIATPGRLIDHLRQKTISLNKVKILVLDEADRMLDMGFAPQIKTILQTVSKERQTMLFSATMPAEIVQIAKSYMQLPTRVEVAPPGTANTNISQEVFFIGREDKAGLLESLLRENSGSVLVFTRTKFGAKKVSAVLKRDGHTSAEIHSNRSLNQRLEALNGFKLGKYRILVATDIAARGIDVTGISLVVNFDLPERAEDYVHRIGRTGRAGHIGKAVSFVTPDQKFDLRSIERLLKKELKVSKVPVLPKRTPAQMALKNIALNEDIFASERPQRKPFHRRPERLGFPKKKTFYTAKRPLTMFGRYKDQRGL
jgi:ATP-dependent RNA helicase RhlE